MLQYTCISSIIISSMVNVCLRLKRSLQWTRITRPYLGLNNLRLRAISNHHLYMLGRHPLTCSCFFCQRIYIHCETVPSQHSTALQGSHFQKEMSRLAVWDCCRECYVKILCFCCILYQSTDYSSSLFGGKNCLKICVVLCCFVLYVHVHVHLYEDDNIYTIYNITCEI